MKKIPTLFKREFENHRVVKVLPEVTNGFEWVLAGDGVATVKYDGSCAMVKDGKLYKRYDAKRGKKPPEGAIPCQEPDPVTGHWPHWVEVIGKPEDKWFISAYEWSGPAENGTYEAVGPHFQGNPHRLYHHDTMIRHGAEIVDVVRSFDGIREYLKQNEVEGLVFWKDGEPQCKIKRSDFGFEWPVR
jgi:hypothetical protein